MCILTKQNCVQWCWSGQKHGLVDVPFWWFKLSPRDSCLQWFPWIAGWVMFTWDMSHLLTQIVSSGNWRQCSQLLIRRNKNMCISCIWRFILSPICWCFVWGLHWSWLPKCTCRWLQPPVCRGLSPIGGSWELSKGGYDHLLNPCIVPIGHFREVQIVERLFSNVFCSQQSPARWITRNRHNEYSISECDSFIEASGLFVCVYVGAWIIWEKIKTTTSWTCDTFKLLVADFPVRIHDDQSISRPVEEVFGPPDQFENTPVSCCQTKKLVGSSVWFPNKYFWKTTRHLNSSEIYHYHEIYPQWRWI